MKLDAIMPVLLHKACRSYLQESCQGQFVHTAFVTVGVPPVAVTFTQWLRRLKHQCGQCH